jgi:tetratricopeptide (TPR) repeat protein
MSPVRLIALVLFLLTVVLFSRVRDFEFVNFDDPSYVTENLHVQNGLTKEGLAWAFGRVHGDDTYWHPLTWVSHMLDFELFGPQPGVHHFMNVLFHALAAALLFHTLRRMTGALWRSAIVAALFAWHPLQVEGVAWVAERKNVLAGLFWVLTMLAYLRYTERPAVARYSIVVFCFALGLMCKPLLVTLPCVLSLLDFWPLRRVKAEGGTKAARARPASNPVAVPLRRAVLEKFPLLALSLVSSVITLIAHQQLGTTISGAELPLGSRVENAIVSYGRYLLKVIWPADLTAYYPMPAAWAGWQILLSLVVVVAITCFVFVLRKRAPYLPVGWLWFLGVMVPAIGIVQASTQSMADRFAYLPLIGLFIAAVWGIDEWLRRFPERRRIAMILAGAVLFASAALTWSQLGYWRNSITLFSHALAVTKENSVAHINLGTALEAMGRREEAMKHYEEGIRLKPKSPQGYNNLANVLDDLGRFDEAVTAYEQALRLRPNVALVHNNLGVTLAKHGRYEAARANFQHAIDLKPADAQGHYLMGTLHLRMGDARSAVSAFQTALSFNPNHFKALVYLARVLAANEDASVRNGAQAVMLAEKAMTLSGGEQPAVLDTLAMACAEAGRFDDAVKSEQAAAELLKSSNDKVAIAETAQRLALYHARQPFREKATNLFSNPGAVPSR